MYRCLLAVT
uniref:Uncharacterized protein n=1 Tax=Arundo donax TaxID=35708 RepID=A0A0A9AF44_ARUDO